MGRRVLIADDEPSIVLALEYLLQRQGYEVHVASNGEEALRMVDRCRPDLVLLDVMMPLRSGYEVCRRIREQPETRHIKVVMLTARSREADEARGLGAGADLYVAKPFSTSELAERVAALLAE